MFLDFLFQKKKETPKPDYLDRIDEKGCLKIIRLKGVMDQSVIPAIEERIQDNRRQGGKIDSNILLDFKNVIKVDSATIAFHIIRIKEYQAEGYKIGFMNVPQEYKAMLDIFKTDVCFRIYDDEEKAIKQLCSLDNDECDCA